MSGHRGEVNGWACDTCGESTYVVHVDDGTTPMFLGCRASAGVCPGRGVSMMYPRGPVPDHVRRAVAWEWYEPGDRERRRLRRREPETYQHVEMGGLLLRPLTRAGRDALDGLPPPEEPPDRPPEGAVRRALRGIAGGRR